MKHHWKLGLLSPYCLFVALSLPGIAFLAGCGGGEDEAAVQPGHALLPESSVSAAGDSTALAAYDLDKEIAAVEEQLGVDLHSLQGVMKDPEAEQSEVLPDAATGSESTAPAALTVPVETTPVQKTTVPTIADPAGAGDFGLQLGSFRTLERANNLSDRLRELGHQPVIETAEVSGQLWQRVCLWGLSDKPAATRLGDRLHNELGIDYLVRQRP